MSEAAVADSEVTETKAENADETKDTAIIEADGVTDVGGTVQTEDAPERDYAAEAEAARLEAVKAEARREVEEESERKRKTEALEAEKRQIFRKGMDAMVAHGAALGLSEEDLKAFTDAYEGFSAGARDFHLRPFEMASSNVLPEEVRDAFVREAEGKVADEYMAIFGRYYAEAHAAETKWGKTLTLNDALAASSRLKAQHTAALDAAFEDGRKKGRSDPAGEPTTEGTSVNRRSLTLQQIDAMPTTEWFAIAREERNRILEDAHRLAGG